ncbi:uncharacterized protein JN550_013683 [Neoarthrinium moseri]|uniref:uncharacterized protein n=1 Tax=Neoarthrinium moseri TaxID=1658444 RepID=UPI001FDC440C|nr:uncharacterized protein JN550_013683 [Neoarthrinium moseri]KAI1856716.1 hypothetical protein JN550_013683 [Neoarthrinium moseri]
MRKFLGGILTTGIAASAAVHTMGLSIPLGVYKAKSTYVARKKRNIVRAELQRRGESKHKWTLKDVVAGAGPAAVSAVVGVEMGYALPGITGMSGVEMAIHLPEDAIESTGLFNDSSALVEGAIGQAGQLSTTC